MIDPLTRGPGLPRPQSTFARRLFPVFLLIVVTALAAGCGSKSSKPETTAEWADGVCSAITTWTDSVKTAAEPVTSGDLSKDSLQGAADDVKSATDTLGSDLKDLGKPDTAAGQQAQDSVDQLATELSTNADDIKTAVDGASGVSGIATAVATVSTTLTTMKSEISSTYTSLTQLDAKGELQDAFQQSSACQALSSSS